MERLRIGPLRREDREWLAIDARENDRGVEQQALFLLRHVLRQRHRARLKRRTTGLEPTEDAAGLGATA
jgi:hypothetical protein